MSRPRQRFRDLLYKKLDISVVRMESWCRRTRAGVGVDNGNALLAGTVLEEALLRTVVTSAGQARKIDQDGDLGSRALESLRRKEQVKLHFAIGGSSLVGKLQELASERGNGGSGFDGHDLCSCNKKLRGQEREKNEIGIYY